MDSKDNNFDFIDSDILKSNQLLGLKYPNTSDDLDEFLKKICISNGLSQNTIKQDSPSCLSLTLFFVNLEKINHNLKLFSNLQSLEIIGIPNLGGLENLNYLEKLKELWLIECALEKIPYLISLFSLEKLFLYSNNIVKIEKLEKLKNLQVLNLNTNKIQIVENLNLLTNLEELYLCENLIQTVGFSLNKLEKLKHLDLSGNQIFQLEEIHNFKQIPNLESLVLKNILLIDSNPLPSFVHYPLYVLFHLPFLKYLDNENVQDPLLKSNLGVLVEGRIKTYNMKKKDADRKYFNNIKLIDKEEEQTIMKIKRLIYHMREIITPNTSQELKNHIFKEMENLLIIFNRAKKEYRRIKRIEERKRRRVEKNLSDEMDSFGNISFQDGTFSDEWYQACCSIIKSRFCSIDNNFKLLNYNDILVTGVLKVENWLMRNKFSSYVEEKTMEEEKKKNNLIPYIPLETHNLPHQFDYLFYVYNDDISNEEKKKKNFNR